MIIIAVLVATLYILLVHIFAIYLFIHSFIHAFVVKYGRPSSRAIKTDPSTLLLWFVYGLIVSSEGPCVGSAVPTVGVPFRRRWGLYEVGYGWSLLSILKRSHGC